MQVLKRCCTIEADNAQVYMGNIVQSEKPRTRIDTFHFPISVVWLLIDNHRPALRNPPDHSLVVKTVKSHLDGAN